MLDDALELYKIAHGFDIKDDQRLKIYYAEGLTYESKKKL